MSSEGALVNREWHQALASQASNFRRLCFVGEIAEVNGFPISSDLGYPRPHSFVPVDATMGRRSTVAGSVLRVLPLQQDAEIGTTAVQAVTVDVVAFEAVTLDKTEQLTVQLDLDVPSFSAPSVDCIPTTTQTPLVLACPLGIGSVDGDVRADGSVDSTQRQIDGAISARDRFTTTSSLIGCPAGASAIQSLPALDFAWPRDEVFSTVGACTGNLETVTLWGHRTYLRCQAPAVDAVRSHLLPSKYTRSLRVEAA